MKLPAVGKKRRLSEQVYQVLVSAIINHEIRPGTRLFEDDLAKQLGVSGTTVREALAKLEQDGLVVKSPHRFTMVPKLSQQDIEEIYDLRLALETLVIRRVHEKITPEDLVRLKELVTKGEEALEQGDLNGLVHYNEEFHDALCELGGNRRLIRMLQILRKQIRLFRARGIKDYPGLEEHKRIVEALEQRDCERAIGEMSKHIIRGKEYYLRELAGSPSGEAHDERGTSVNDVEA
ncbi:MAG: GntR family transcriptional regulator [Limnochordia bacterium]